MKKMLNFALGYALAGMAGGVFFREFTKFNGYTGVTTLGKIHTHLFMLGMFMFMIVALFTVQTSLKEQKKFKIFLITYNMGVIVTTSLMLIRGIFQVLGSELSKGANASISGISGIGHILTSVGIVLLILALKDTAKNNS